jgi:Peptidase family M28/PA domain
MRRGTLVALALLAAQWLYAASIPSAESPGFDAIRSADLKADVAFLASDALQGRMSLTTGSEAAIEWIKSEFEKAGLAPAANGSYLQPVPLWEFRIDREQSFLRIDVHGEEQTFKYPEAYGQFRQDVNITGPLVFAGYGITAPELNYDDYKNIDVQGKLVLIFDHEPQETDAKSIFNGRGNTRYATARVKVLNAQAHGATGVLIVAEPNRKHVSNQERIAKIAGTNSHITRIRSQAIDGDEVHIPYMTVSDQVAAELIKASGTTPSKLQSEIDKDLTIASRPLPETTVTLRLQNAERRRGTSFNVAGVLEGSDRTLSPETVLISAHSDHDGAEGAQIWHGADDNGSGTAGVVELAHAFASNRQKPRRSILFIVFTAEERGLLGSYYYAQHPLRPLEATRAVINFDMIGRNETSSRQTDGLIEIAPDTSNEVNLIGTMYSPDYRHAVEQENEYVGLHLNYKWDQEASLNIFFRSDQFPFALRGIPAIWWFTGFHPDYHQTSDTADKINYAKMEKILKLAYLTAWDFGDTSTPPKFNLRTSE